MSTATMVVSVVTIFFLIFALSFAVGPVPEGRHRFSKEWTSAWFKASLPRIIIAGVFSGGLFLASWLSGGNSTNAQDPALVCRQPIPALSNAPVTTARIETAADSLRDVADAATAGDYRLAQALFYGETHNLSHDIDRPLREADQPLAVALCENVVTLEVQLPTGTNLGLIQSAAEKAAGQLDEAAGVLGEQQ